MGFLKGLSVFHGKPWWVMIDMDEDRDYGTQFEVDIIEQVGDERTKVGDAVLIARADGVSISLGPWKDVQLIAGNGYEFVLKPGTDRTIKWPKTSE